MMTSTLHSRRLTEARIRRVLHTGGKIRQRGGRAELTRRLDDKSTVIGLISPHILARLIADGVWHPTRKPVAPPKPASSFTAFSMGVKSHIRSQSAMDTVLLTSPLPIPAARLAIARFMADFDLSTRASANGQAAAARLAAVEARIGAPAMQRLERAIIGRASLASLTAGSGQTVTEVTAELFALLQKLMEV